MPADTHYKQEFYKSLSAIRKDSCEDQLCGLGYTWQRKQDPDKNIQMLRLLSAKQQFEK